MTTEADGACSRFRATLSLAIAPLFLGLLFAPSLGRAETLDEAWKTALGADHRLKASQQFSSSTREALEAARAARFPNLSLEAGYTRLNEPPAAALGSPVRQLPLQQAGSASYRATATLPLYTSGRISSSIDAAEARVKASGADEAHTALELKLTVAQAYVAALRAAQTRDVAHSHVASLTAFAHDVANFHEQGMAARNDLLAAQVALAEARQGAIQADNGVDLAHAGYNRLLGRDLAHPVELAELAPATDRPQLDAATRDALARRPELLTLSEQAQALRHEADSVRGSGGPQLFVSGGYNFQENKYQVHEGYWAVTLGMRWQVFDAGLIRGQAATVARLADSIDSLREDARSKVALEVRQAWLDVDETRRRITVARTAVGQADESLKVARDRYGGGMGTYTEVLDAETARIRTLTNLHNAVYDAVLADLWLRRATGAL